MRFFLTIFSLIVFFMLLGGCASTPVKEFPLPGEPVADFPKMQIGDSWSVEGYSRYVDKDTYHRKIIEVSTDGSFVQEVNEEKRGNKYYQRFDNNYNRVGGEEGSLYLNFPLFVGKQWKDRYRGRSIDGSYYNYRNTYNVVAFEKVSTRAGIFDAFKIKRYHYNISTNQSVPDTENYWYAPDIKIVVKSIPSWRIGGELVSYSLSEFVNDSEQKKVEFTQKPAKEDSLQILISGEKVNIGILEIQPLNNEAENARLGKVFTEILTTSFVSSEAFKIIEREQLNKVLNEIKLTQSGIIDTSNIKMLGSMVGADAIVVGSITKLADDLRLDIRIVDVESGLILTAEKIEGKTDIRSIGIMADTVVAGLVNRFYREKN
jgi:TolB-like protein